MRLKDRKKVKKSSYKLLIVDDDKGIIDAVREYFEASGHEVDGETDPVKAVEVVRNGNYDILLLDFLMAPIHGDEVVARIREFNTDLYIVLLTGHKDLAPPIKTIRELEIQGYYEKSDKLDQLELLVESCIKSIEQMRIIRKFKDGLNSILQAVPQIYQLQPIDQILEQILSTLIPMAESRDAFILVDEETTETAINLEKKSIFKGIGKYGDDVGAMINMLEPYLIEQIGLVRSENKMVKLENQFILPLNNEHGECIGVICVETDMPKIDDDTIALFEIYAKQAGSSLSNAFLHSLVNIKNDELNKTYELLRNRYMDTISALRLVVDAKDIYTRGHSDRVSYYAVKIGDALRLNTDDIENLRIGGLFHDVGKIGTADDLLIKNQKLEPAEYEEIKKHPLKGAHILSAVSMFKDVVNIVRCHHERIDGMGYPSGLSGENIPLLARIVMVADAFDAMMSDRRYRSHLSLEDAKQQLIEGKDTQFDASIVDVFLKLLEGYDDMCKELAWTFAGEVLV